MSEQRWKKSSRSGSTSQCVELAYEGGVRDSKNPTGPALAFDRIELVAFLAGVKDGHFSS